MTGADQSRANVHLTLAIGDYDHTRDLVSGAVHVPGVDLTCMSFSIEETFSRFARYHEWDISEFSLAQYCALLARGDDWLTAIPVFPSRAFTHGTIFIRRDGPVDDPRALAGKRAGTPDWEDTGGIYTRGLLKQRYGLDLGEVEWFQACDAGDLSLWDMLAIGDSTR